MNSNDTPRTDELIKRFSHGSADDFAMHARFLLRQLERELAAAKAEIETLRRPLLFVTGDAGVDGPIDMKRINQE